MFKNKLTKGDLFLIAINLVPLFGVWFKNWDPKQMFLIYGLETVIAGFYNIIKMAIITLYRKTDTWENGAYKKKVSGWFFILFFIMHYGLFVFVQMSIFGAVTGLIPTGLGFLGFMFHINRYLTHDSLLVLYGFMMVYGLQMIMDFILKGEYRKTPLTFQMFQPYPRIFIQQFVVIIGSMFLVFGAGKIFMVIFVVIKILFELYFNFDKILAKAQKDRELAAKSDS